jgi:Uma2 family endonuclease
VAAVAGDKFEHYKRIESLAQYVLISHRSREIEVWTRSGGDWTSSIVREGARANLASIGAELDVSELYAAAAEPH